jgi:hypothetical protein
LPLSGLQAIKQEITKSYNRLILRSYCVVIYSGPFPGFAPLTVASSLMPLSPPISKIIASLNNGDSLVSEVSISR